MNYRYFQYLQNFISIGISNLFSQVLGFLIVILLTKNLETIYYGNFILFIAIGNSLILFLEPLITPFILKQGVIEYDSKKNLSNTIGIFIRYSSISIIFILFIFFLIPEKFVELKILYRFYCSIYFICLIILIVSKLIFRISNNLKLYNLFIFLDKFLLLSIILVFLYFNFLSYHHLIISLLLVNFLVAGISLFFVFKITDLNIFSIECKNSYLKTIKYMSFSTILTFIITNEYFIVFANILTNDKKIIASIGISFFIVASLLAPIFWLEQLINPKLNLFVTKKNTDSLYYFYNQILTAICIIYSFIIYLGIFLIVNTEILAFIFSEDIFENRYILSLLMFQILLNILNSFVSINIFANNDEGIILKSSIIRFLIFIILLIYFKEFKILLFAYIFSYYIYVVYLLYCSNRYISKNYNLYILLGINFLCFLSMFIYEISRVANFTLIFMSILILIYLIYYLVKIDLKKSFKILFNE